MINANELRIGNWVMVKEDDDILHIKISALAATEIFVDPIPLTPEILEKCGFEKDSDDEGDWLQLLIYGGDYMLLYSYKDKAVSLDDFPMKVYSLHQLQNLYFALTGNEIEYKP